MALASVRTAFFPGSFDPPTHGHVDVVRQAAGLADRLVIGIGVNAAKAPMFSAGERAAMLAEVCGGLLPPDALTILPFEGLAVEAARRAGAGLMLRGLRDGTDLDYEMQIAGMNAALAPEVQTVFVPASPLVRPIAATLVRQVAAMGGDVSAFVPPAVLRRLRERFPERAAAGA